MSSQPGPSRRRFILIGGATGLSAGLGAACAGEQHAGSAAGSAGASAATGRVVPADAQQGERGTQPAEAFTFFNPHQAALVQAAAARIIPTDENGPGATEAGVVYFIDRQLASEFGLRGKEYQSGPFVDGAPTQGDQSMLSMRDRYRIGLAGMDTYAQQRFGRGFLELSESEQDQVLVDLEAGRADAAIQRVEIESTPVEILSSGSESIQRALPDGKVFGLAAFFHILRGHTIAGFFADPVHGGNRDLVGWKLIGFPGAQIGGYRDWILNYGVPFDGPFMSLSEYQARAAFRGHEGGH